MEYSEVEYKVGFNITIAGSVKPGSFPKMDIELGPLAGILIIVSVG